MVELFLGLLRIAAVIAIPLALVVAMARWSRSIWIAAAAAFIAVPLQLLGLTSTCTQGADGTFITGAILSSPFLLGATCAVMWARNKRLALLTGGAVTVAIVLAMVALTRDAWLGAMMYGTPCGEPFAWIPTSGVDVGIILTGYLILPLLLIACTIWAICKPGVSQTSDP